MSKNLQTKQRRSKPPVGTDFGAEKSGETQVAGRLMEWIREMLWLSGEIVPADPGTGFGERCFFINQVRWFVRVRTDFPNKYGQII
jgi:hypothetical protein